VTAWEWLETAGSSRLSLNTNRGVLLLGVDSDLVRLLGEERLCFYAHMV